MGEVVEKKEGRSNFKIFLVGGSLVYLYLSRYGVCIVIFREVCISKKKSFGYYCW